MAGRCGRACDAEVEDKTAKASMLDILREAPTWADYGLDESDTKI